MRKPFRLDPTLDFLRTLWATTHALETRSARMNKALGLSGPQRLVVRLIGKFPGITASELSELLHLTRGTLSIQLLRLEKLGLVLRRADPSDRRRAFLELTAAAKKRIESRRGTVEATVSQFLARQSESSIVQAKKMLMALAKELAST